MDKEKLIENVCNLYKKEREYQICAHGDYNNVETLNLGSFMVLIETYLNKAKASYSGPWTNQKPDWLVNCKENAVEGFAPVEAYEEIIKVFALAGAALETYAAIDPEKWRGNIEEDLKKWQKEKE
jgi:hypothetical protein